MDTTYLWLSLGLSAAVLVGYKIYRGVRLFLEVRSTLDVALPIANRLLEDVITAGRLPPNITRKDVDQLISSTELVYASLRRELGHCHPRYGLQLRDLHRVFQRLSTQVQITLDERGDVR